MVEKKDSNNEVYELDLNIPQTMGNVLIPPSMVYDNIEVNSQLRGLTPCTSVASRQLSYNSIYPQSLQEQWNEKSASVARKTNLGTNGNDNDRVEIEEEKTYPEGGWKAWSIVFGSCSVMTSCFGYMNSLGTFQAHISHNQLKGYSESQIGWIFSMYVFLSFFFGIFTGPFFDKHGPRRLLIAGAIGQVIAIQLLSLCTSYWHFMLNFGVLNGISTALLFPPSVAVVAHYFRIRRGYATGVACTGGSLGGIMFPLILQSLIPKVGFPWAIRVLGFISIVLLLNGILILKPRFKDSRSQGLVDISAFKDPMFTLTTIGIFILELALFVPVSYITSYALSSGIKESTAYQLLTILNVGSLFGRWLPGLLTDKVGAFNTMLLCSILCFLSVFAIWLPAAGNLGPLIAFVLIFGFASGSGISVTPVCISQICRIEDYGKRYGTAYFVVSFGSLVGIPVAGSMISAMDGKYDALIMFTGACYVVCFAFFLAARVKGGGWKIRVVF